MNEEAADTHDGLLSQIQLLAASSAASGSEEVPDEHFRMAWERHYGGYHVESNTVSVLDTNTVDLLRLVPVGQQLLLKAVDAQAIYQVGKLTPNFVYKWTAMVIRDDEPTHLESDEEVLAFLKSSLDLGPKMRHREVLAATALPAPPFSGPPGAEAPPFSATRAPSHSPRTHGTNSTGSAAVPPTDASPSPQPAPTGHS